MTKRQKSRVSEYAALRRLETRLVKTVQELELAEDIARLNQFLVPYNRTQKLAEEARALLRQTQQKISRIIPTTLK